MMGDQARPEVIRGFSNPWKDADSDIPIYQQAKAEYSQTARKLEPR